MNNNKKQYKTRLGESKNEFSDFDGVRKGNVRKTNLKVILNPTQLMEIREEVEQYIQIPSELL